MAGHVRCSGHNQGISPSRSHANGFFWSFRVYQCRSVRNVGLNGDRWMILTRGPTSDIACNRHVYPTQPAVVHVAIIHLVVVYLRLYIQPCLRPFISILHRLLPTYITTQLLAFTRHTISIYFLTIPTTLIIPYHAHLYFATLHLPSLSLRGQIQADLRYNDTLYCKYIQKQLVSVSPYLPSILCIQQLALLRLFTFHE